MDFKMVAKEIHRLRLEEHNLRQQAWICGDKAARLEKAYERAQRAEFTAEKIINDISDEVAVQLLNRLKELNG